MKSLKQILVEAEILEEDDITVISRYLRQPEVVKKVPSLLTDILEDTIGDLQSFKHKQIEWQTIPFSYYYQQYPIGIAETFDRLTRMIIADMSLSESDCKWIRDNVPNLELGSAFYIPLLKKIHDCGVYFKNEKECAQYVYYGAEGDE